MKHLSNKVLAEKIRTAIIDRASTGGFHFSSSLGVVELTIALYRVFDFHKDPLVFDVGHQRFPYIMLKTGKFEVPLKEDYNMYLYPGFAGLSVSSALGLSVANADQKSIAIVGDGSLTCGEVFEGLNNSGEAQRNMLVILNQNGQSIGDNVGALSDGKRIKSYAESLKFEYVGVDNGHDVDALVQVLSEIKNKKHPVFLHVLTQKGKGYAPSEKSPSQYHRPTTPFDIKSGEISPNTDNVKEVLGKALEILQTETLKRLERGEQLYLTSPACPLFQKVADKFPGHVFDSGISEQHCLTFSTALANSGRQVISTIIAPFVARCYSQLLDLCHQNAPLVLSIPMSGATGLGSTHQAVHLLGALKLIPDLTIAHASNLSEYQSFLNFSLEMKKPIVVFVPKENIECASHDKIESFKATTLTCGDKLTVLPIGSMFTDAFNIAKNFSGVEVINPRFLKPFDYATLYESLKKTGRLLILEDGLRQGGVGEEILSKLYNDMPGVHCRHIAYKGLYPATERYDEAMFEYGVSSSRCLSEAQLLLKKETLFQLDAVA